MMKRRDHTPITGKKIKSMSSNEKKQALEQGDRVSFVEKKHNIVSNQSITSQSNKQNQRPQFYEGNRNSSSANTKPGSKIVKNNFVKGNTTMNESRTTNQMINQSNPVTNASMIISEVKQLGNKSVLIVKPNQFGTVSNDSVNLGQSRNSKRKIYDHDNKENRFSLNKDTSNMRDSNVNEMKSSKVSNFFRVDNNQAKSQQNERLTKRVDNNNSLTQNTTGRISQSLQGNKTCTSLSKKGSSSIMTKMRSSSTRVSRKDEIPSSNTSISKNYSYTGKGKWKF